MGAGCDVGWQAYKGSAGACVQSGEGVLTGGYAEAAGATWAERLGEQECYGACRKQATHLQAKGDVPLAVAVGLRGQKKNQLHGC